MAEWDVAMMPFALNDSTRYISPTKTPEYLAAGPPVVSTAITDAVKPYGENGLTYIASTAEEFAAAIDQALEVDLNALQASADAFLADKSWDITFEAMRALIDEARNKKGSSGGCLGSGSHRKPGAHFGGKLITDLTVAMFIGVVP